MERDILACVVEIYIWLLWFFWEFCTEKDVFQYGVKAEGHEKGRWVQKTKLSNF